MQTPPVHILMPAYNVEDYIADSLKSVFAQDYPNITLFLLDDASTDNTVDVVSKSDFKEINIEVLKENQGVANCRALLLSKSKATDPEAYFLWLDADDCFTDQSFVSKFVERMMLTKADICLFNFEISYEHESVIPNTLGLLKDQANSEEILAHIVNTPIKTVSLHSYPKVGTFTGLGWTKGYGPKAKFPMAAPGRIFEDFVYMAAIFNADKVTAFDPDYKPIIHLRRVDSLTGVRTPQTFEDIVFRLKEFKQHIDIDNAVTAFAAKEFVNKKITQYRELLENLITADANKNLMTHEVLAKYDMSVIDI